MTLLVMPPLTWHSCCDSPMSLALILMRRSWAGYCLSRPDQSALYFANLAPVLWQRCHVTCVTSIGRHLSFSGLRHFRQWLADWNTDGTGGGQIVSEENMGHGACQCQGPGSVMQTPGPGAGVRCSEQILRYCLPGQQPIPAPALSCDPGTEGAT